MLGKALHEVNYKSESQKIETVQLDDIVYTMKFYKKKVKKNTKKSPKNKMKENIK